MAFVPVMNWCGENSTVIGYLGHGGLKNVKSLLSTLY